VGDGMAAQIEQRLADLVRTEIAQAGAAPPPELRDDTVLQEAGLDSLGFATLVVAMQREFGLDPFAGTEEIVYPETLGELARLYRAETGADGA